MREHENLMMVRSSPGTEVLRGVSNWHFKEGGCSVLVGFLVGIQYFLIGWVELDWRDNAKAWLLAARPLLVKLQ